MRILTESFILPTTSIVDPPGARFDSPLESRPAVLVDEGFPSSGEEDIVQEPAVSVHVDVQEQFDAPQPSVILVDDNSMSAEEVYEQPEASEDNRTIVKRPLDIFAMFDFRSPKLVKVQKDDSSTIEKAIPGSPMPVLSPNKRKRKQVVAKPRRKKVDLVDAEGIVNVETLPTEEEVESDGNDEDDS
jgi:hypothetical protein